MNLSTVALALLAWQLLSKQNTPKTGATGKGNADFSAFLSDDTKSILDCLGKMTDKNCPQSDKLGAILQMINNPTVMNFAQGMFDGNGAATEQKTENFTNEEGYKFETPSATSREFFRPIDKIADPEVKSKLYWFYDNWYL